MICYMIDISRCMLGALTCSYDMSYVCVTCHRSLLHMPWQTDRHTHTQMHHTDASHRCITQTWRAVIRLYYYVP